MDLGIKATWYDLPPEAAEAHLRWLHDEHLPALRARAGHAWVAHYRTVPARTGADRTRLHEVNDPAVGRGTQFLLLIGAPSVDVFFAAPDAPTEQEGAMLAQRAGARTCLYVEEARLNGPEFRAAVPGATPSAVIQFGSFNTQSFEDAFELGAYYRQNRFPALAATPGCIRTRKLLAAAGWARHGILYEFTSLEARRDHFEEHVEWGSDPAIAKPDNPHLWAGRYPTQYVVFAPGAPTIAVRTWP